MVWLASDEDREGEAISWHLAEELKLDSKKPNELFFMKSPSPPFKKQLKIHAELTII
ncbi:toprim domain-containing protein [Flavobacterium piscinae]|uniref:toprim domain-containing protein n=1 Tax=Flavobacterium piscinae TaxID=2506424 RepID=UPI0037099369